MKIIISSYSCESINLTRSIASAISCFARAIFSSTAAIIDSTPFDFAKKPMLFSKV